MIGHNVTDPPALGIPRLQIFSLGAVRRVGFVSMPSLPFLVRISEALVNFEGQKPT
jgi:hypothetical protein